MGHQVGQRAIGLGRRVQHDVRRFDVAMGDAGIVGGLQAVGDIGQHGHGHLMAERPTFLDQFAGVGPAEQLHHEPAPAVVSSGIPDLDDGVIAQPCDGDALPAESLGHRRIGRAGQIDDLDRHCALEQGVEAPPHPSGCPLADLGHELVAASQQFRFHAYYPAPPGCVRRPESPERELGVVRLAESRHRTEQLGVDAVTASKIGDAGGQIGSRLHGDDEPARMIDRFTHIEQVNPLAVKETALAFQHRGVAGDPGDPQAVPQDHSAHRIPDLPALGARIDLSPRPWAGADQILGALAIHSPDHEDDHRHHSEDADQYHPARADAGQEPGIDQSDTGCQQQNRGDDPVDTAELALSMALIGQDVGIDQDLFLHDRPDYKDTPRARGWAQASLMAAANCDW
ncbi:hypothetical protein SDC9_117040 [bioreactor metagenome]|uniref:Uncharacterized protein n=1 Tax=bioreactor metagenome TaxID=1076179 RepID=A0A645BYA0_9ZZZZ